MTTTNETAKTGVPDVIAIRREDYVKLYRVDRVARHLLLELDAAERAPTIAGWMTKLRAALAAVPAHGADIEDAIRGD